MRNSVLQVRSKVPKIREKLRFPQFKTRPISKQMGRVLRFYPLGCRDLNDIDGLSIKADLSMIRFYTFPDSVQHSNFSQLARAISHISENSALLSVGIAAIRFVDVSLYMLCLSLIASFTYP